MEVDVRSTQDVAEGISSSGIQLEENYSTMIHWLEYIQKKAEEGIPERLKENLTLQSRERQKYLWNTGFHFGDWLIPRLTAGYILRFGKHGTPLLPMDMSM